MVAVVNKMHAIKEVILQNHINKEDPINKTIEEILQNLTTVGKGNFLIEIKKVDIIPPEEIYRIMVAHSEYLMFCSIPILGKRYGLIDEGIQLLVDTNQKANNNKRYCRSYGKNAGLWRAADLAKETGKKDKALELYLLLQSYVKAAEIIQESGDSQRALEILVTNNKYEEAAKLAEKSGLYEKAKELFIYVLLIKDALRVNKLINPPEDEKAIYAKAIEQLEIEAKEIEIAEPIKGEVYKIEDPLGTEMYYVKNTRQTNREKWELYWKAAEYANMIGDSQKATKILKKAVDEGGIDCTDPSRLIRYCPFLLEQYKAMYIDNLNFIHFGDLLMQLNRYDEAMIAYEMGGNFRKAEETAVTLGQKPQKNIYTRVNEIISKYKALS